MLLGCVEQPHVVRDKLVRFRPQGASEMDCVKAADDG